jgi:hypothetical protein
MIGTPQAKNGIFGLGINFYSSAMSHNGFYFCLLPRSLKVDLNHAFLAVTNGKTGMGCSSPLTSFSSTNERSRLKQDALFLIHTEQPEVPVMK